jgi:SNF2 family DNA or RNA helicase
VIGLTGTPIENSVEELRNLLELVLPGYLPSESVFRKDFVRPVEEGDPGAQDRLRRLIRPFVLRRTKQQVLTSLPEKIEDRRVCSMTPGQALLYSDYLEGRAGDLRRGLLSGKTVSYLHVFALLSKLKQICDHPALVQEPGTEPVPSGKWDLFVDLLDEALSSGLKVVVFSQYVRMLDFMGHFLDERGIRFAEIRGATVDRATPVRRFREDPDHRVFLASLNAAGAGIDLSAGSVVIHYDRWWNQAKEDQATDRVHRLGQTRGVQVLNLVTKGTVEERIERLIEKKARLSREVVPEDDAGLLKRFSRDELMDLLSPAGQ